MGDAGVLDWPLHVAAGSWRPEHIVISDPGPPIVPLDLTGCTARMVINSRRDGRGVVLATLSDSSGLRLTSDGRLYFEPTETVTSGWVWRHGWHQVELAHPAGRTVRVAAGPVSVSPELVTP